MTGEVLHSIQAQMEARISKYLLYQDSNADWKRNKIMYGQVAGCVFEVP